MELDPEHPNKILKSRGIYKLWEQSLSSILGALKTRPAPTYQPKIPQLINRQSANDGLALEKKLWAHLPIKPEDGMANIVAW